MKEEDVKKNNLCNYYTDYFFIIVVCCNLLHFLKDNYYCISVYYIQLGTNMITLLRLLYISALARIEKLPQKKL